MDGATAIGAPVGVAAGIADRTIGASTLTPGTHDFTAVFTPVGAFVGSDSGAAIGLTMTLPAPAVIVPASLGGSVRVAGVAACSAGVWTYAGTYAYNWFLDTSSSPLAAHGANLPIPAAYYRHRIRCQVVVGNPSGRALSMTPQAIVGAAPAPVARTRPTIRGVARVGKTLAANRGVWRPVPTGYTFTWKRDGRIVKSGPRAAAYRLTKADKGKSITVTITVTKTGYLAGVSVSPRVVVR
jgi:hypothetical protein